VFQLAADTVAIRSLDYDRDRFDIEFGCGTGSSPGGRGGCVFLASLACRRRGS
jgi:hypothetical protein